MAGVATASESSSSVCQGAAVAPSSLLRGGPAATSSPWLSSQPRWPCGLATAASPARGGEGLLGGRRRTAATTASASADGDAAKGGAAKGTQEEEAAAGTAGADGGGAEEGAKKEAASSEAEAKAAADGDKKEEGAAAAEPAKELSEADKLQSEVEKLEEKKRAKRTELLLALADFENHKKRFMKERQVRRRNATVNFSRKMVEVYDEFQQELAGSLAAGGGNDEPHESCQALLEGVVLTKDLYKAALERFDVMPIAPELGKPLEAARHEDVGFVAGGELPANTIGEVVREGWVLAASRGDGAAHATVLRKARVKVAKPEAEAF